METTAVQEQNNNARKNKDSQLKNRREAELTLTNTDTERRNAKRAKPKESLAQKGGMLPHIKRGNDLYT